MRLPCDCSMLLQHSGLHRVTPERYESHISSSMSQTTHQVIDVGNNPGNCHSLRLTSHRFHHFMMSITDDHPDHPQSTPNSSSQEFNFGDSSGPFFSIYSKTAEEEDNKMVDRWQKDADGILIFVSPCVCNYIILSINRNTIDWSILCRGCCAPCLDRPRPEAK